MKTPTIEEVKTPKTSIILWVSVEEVWLVLMIQRRFGNIQP